MEKAETVKAPMSGAERQAAYRKGRSTAGENGERRLNTWVSTAASLALKRLAAHYCVTNREMLERLILKADEDLQKTLESDEAFAKYFSVTA